MEPEEVWRQLLMIAWRYLRLEARRTPAIPSLLRLYDAQESARGSAPIAVTETREVSTHEEAPNGGVPARPNARPVARSASTSRARLEAMIRRADKRRKKLDSRAAAKRLGVTPAHARRLLTEVRKSHAQEPVTN